MKSLDQCAGDGAGVFKEHEGTGMGEGQGAKDVSDKIENEDQLLGAQQKGQEEQQVSWVVYHHRVQ